ncbi:GNAT family N-acetyltransferase [Streptomyces sp. NPDC050560]|uniref:GNAT family N-acetyltransferase n=1 Tax=Streptomyces sp. NPDC050560 TaxID=3365630 RepID=UPI0037BD926D
MEPVTLTTGRLLLRTVAPFDAPALYDACQDPGIQRWTQVPSPYLPEHAESFAAHQVPDGWRDDTAYNFGAFLRTDSPDGTPARDDDSAHAREGAAGAPHPREGALVGMIGVIRRLQRTGEIGFWVAPQHRGRGYVTEGALAVTRWAFTGAGIDRMEWRAEVGNAPSRTAALKIGFTLEGTLRSGLSNKGVRRDCWIGSLLPHELGLDGTEPYLPTPA